jgi:hypothetical protein
MGLLQVFDPVISLYALLRLTIVSLLEQQRAFSAVLKRIDTPALPPISNPTQSAWQDHPDPEFPEKPLPDEVVDVLIIGSGITGASVARELLSSDEGKDMRIAMVDARGVCSGATVYISHFLL